VIEADRRARDELLGALSDLLEGAISGEEFRGRVPESTDPAVRELLLPEAWRLFCGTRPGEPAAVGELPNLVRPEISRWVLFLKTSWPYRWPVLSGSEGRLLRISSIATLGLASRLRRRRLARDGDLDVWPFHRREQYLEALAKPPHSGREGRTRRTSSS